MGRLAVSFGRLASWLNSLGSLWVFCLMVLVCADITGRNVFNAPLLGVPEILAYSMIAVVYLQLPHTLYVGRVTRADILITWLAHNRPVGGAALNALFCLIGAGVFGYLAWLSYPQLVQAIAEHEIDGRPGTFVLSVWPFRLILTVGAVGTAVGFAIQAGEASGELARRWAESRGGTGERRTGWPVLALFAGVVAAAVAFVLGAPSNVAIGLVSVAFMLALVGFGMHIGIVLIIVGFVGSWLIRGRLSIAEYTLLQAGTEFLRNHVLAVIPLFVMMGLLVGASDMGRETFDVARWMLRRIKGGLGVATVAANAVFAAITGSSIASAAVFTRIATPEMMRYGYTPRFSVGVVAGTSVLGMLIPPSLLLIVYGFLSEQSVGILFLAAIVPGLILALAMGLGIVFMASRMPRLVGGRPVAEDEAGETIGSSLAKLAPILVLVVVVLGGIYGGILTPAEAGAAGAFGALVIALARRRIDLPKLWSVLVETGHVTVSILFLMFAANMYSRMIAMSGLPQLVSQLINTAGLGLYSFTAAVIVFLILLGMVLDSVSIMLIVLPLALPAVKALGGDLIWFGIVAVVAIEIGLLTPPVGLTCYVVKSTLDDERISLGDIFAGAFPFVVVMLLVTILLVAVPKLSLVFA